MPHPTLVPSLQKLAPRTRPWNTRRVLQGLAAAALALVAGLVSASGGTGCNRSPQCDPSQCHNPGNVCVNNECKLQCTSHLQCAAGQNCVPAVEDGSGAAIAICQPNGRAGIGTKCPFGNECMSVLSCPDGSNCDYTQCGGGTCTLDAAACAGITGCSIGKCADGTACTVQGCPQSACVPLTCLSTGTADADAYCTLEDCHADTDCPGGYWCEPARDPHQICGQPAPNPSCGMTTDPCVTPSPATTYTKGPLCTVRNQCRIRRQCDPCTTDIDCSAVPGRHCTQVGSSKACTSDCASDADCVSGYQCTSGACVPRAGSCAPGDGKFCQPCRNDTDCAAGFLCVAYENGGEHVCLNPSVTCTTDANCPKSPSGLQGSCTLNGVCDIPLVKSSMLVSCWCQNSGAACGTNAECCSKKCAGATATQTGTCQ